MIVSIENNLLKKQDVTVLCAFDTTRFCGMNCAAFNISAPLVKAGNKQLATCGRMSIDTCILGEFSVIEAVPTEV